eukprot:TRINITY_DN39377_c0_g1_i1.p1 TRINITY_DN39377_c0_g1~~TRINITY_DN39377_c0_g1_i1.p1  ORF type:complete len:171 (-),score=14.55 TRINITY_DN39377_c0_g1_i1:2-448(-)
MALFLLVPLFGMIIFVLQGCGELDCEFSPECTSEAGRSGGRCCVCHQLSECMSCKPGFYAIKQAETLDTCVVDGFDYGPTYGYRCVAAYGDMTKCTDPGNDCIALLPSEMTCEKGYVAKALGQVESVGICTGFLDRPQQSQYFTCTPG